MQNTNSNPTTSPLLKPVAMLIIYNSTDYVNYTIAMKPLSHLVGRTAAKRSPYNPIGGYYIFAYGQVYYGSTGDECLENYMYRHGTPTNHVYAFSRNNKLGILHTDLSLLIMAGAGHHMDMPGARQYVIGSQGDASYPHVIEVREGVNKEAPVYYREKCDGEYLFADV